MDGHGPWDVTVELDRLDVDASESDSVPVDSITTLTGGVTVLDDGNAKKLRVPSSADVVEFEGSSKLITESYSDINEAFEVGDITEIRLNVSASVETRGEE
jgi:hypothetical protein